LKGKNRQVNLVEFSCFLPNGEDEPFKLTTKSRRFIQKKVDYEYFKMAILVNDRRQFPSFSLLLWRFCGAFMLE